MFQNLLNNIQNKYNNIKQENANLEQLLQTTTTFQNLFPIQNKTIELSEYTITSILEDCPDLNEEKAKLIATIIPITETYLSILYSKEVLTNKEYYLIPTNQYLWVISPTEYGAFTYNLSGQIIKNNLMSKTILLNNILLEINGNQQKIETFLNILNNINERNKLIEEKTLYLQGIIPIYQQRNKIGSGITLDNESNIIFHTKTDTLKIKKEELINYEILLDNQTYLSKNSNTSNKITKFQTTCYQISIRITTPTSTFIIPILEPNTFGNKYNSHDTILINSLTFAKKIIEKLNSITKANYYN